MPRPTSALLALLLLPLLALAALAQEPYFESDALNPGLGPAPQYLARDTPMGTMEAFLHHTRNGEFQTAAHLLDLSALPEAAQRREGPDLARELSVLMDRKVVVSWGRLADRPDGWLEGSADNNATGRVRRSVLIDVMDLDGREVPLRMNRMKPAGGEPVWLISRQTVANIPNLFARYGPTELELSLPAWSRQQAFWGMYYWEVLFVPLLLVAATALGWITYRGVTHLGRLADTRLVNAIVRALRWPATIIVTTALIGFATRRVLVVSGVIDSFISPAVAFGYVLGVTLGAVLVIDEIFNRLNQFGPKELADPDNAHMRNLATTISAARKFVIVIAVLVGTGLVLTSANTLPSLGLSLLASAGALTIVLGFAAREVLGNILGAVQIALNRSARIGDQLIFEGHYCTVERIHFTYVQLMIWNGNRLIVPVSRFVQDAFENWSLEDRAMIRPIELTFAQEADIAPLRDFFLKTIEEEDGDETGPLEDALVQVTGQDIFGKKVRFALPTPNPNTGWDMQCLMRERLLAEAARLQREGGPRMLPDSNLRDLPEPG